MSNIVVEGDGIYRRIDTAEDQVGVKSDGGPQTMPEEIGKRGKCKRRNCIGKLKADGGSR